ncbi:MAG: AAA family ATPase [Snowella sp.]|nr:AAA family ATPase [Snowella sp.]
MDLSQLIETMQNREFYPHPTSTEIRVIQTHCSIVFLTGNYAYKLKKAVDFGFLDYSTLEKRHHFLQQELVMNQPLAPDIYLSVLPISQVGDRLILDSQENIVEYALKMAEFPQASLLINLFEAGELQEFHLRELGKIVADFHCKTLTNEYIKSFGQIEVIKASIDDNYQATQKYIGIAQTLEQYQATQQFTDNFVVKNQSIFEKRCLTDKIRECHGDLHLKNICYWQNKIQLFDRIEFNEPFRFVDVIYDIAFTVMDLDARGRNDFSNIFLNTYLEQTGDWEGLQVLPFYLCRQAYVRAKVTSMLLDDPNIAESEKQAALETAKNYYQLAWQYTQSTQGKIILMSGLSGSGKSTVAKYLAPKINAIHLRSDAVRKHLAEIPLDQAGDDNLYCPEMSEKTYQKLLNLGILLAKQGFSVILDAKYDRTQWRSPIIEAAQQAQIPLQIFYCHAPIETLQTRLQERRGDISDATPDLLNSQQASAEPFSEPEQPYVIPLNTQGEDWKVTLEAWLN